MGALLSLQDVRALAEQLGVQPTKKLGQNFVHDQNTVRKIVSRAGVGAEDSVLEIGPGLGSLTLGLTETGASVCAVEIDPRLAEALEETVARLQAGARLRVVCGDGMRVRRAQVGQPCPSLLVANLPYNVSVPILLHVLQEFPQITRGLVMVQQEVGERLAARAGSRVYGLPSVKAAWYARFGLAERVSRNIFWPVPNVDSVLLEFQRYEHPLGSEEEREFVFELVNAAFAQRRKMLRQSLRALAPAVSTALAACALPETARAEELEVGDYLALARALTR